MSPDPVVYQAPQKHDNTLKTVAEGFLLMGVSVIVLSVGFAFFWEVVHGVKRHGVGIAKPRNIVGTLNRAVGQGANVGVDQIRNSVKMATKGIQGLGQIMTGLVG